MILPNLILPTLVNQQHESISLDSIDMALNKSHFSNYPHDIDYQYNSRGFRGPEWPSELNDVVWCVGDSFTSGIGIPYNHTWPHLLSTALSVPTINISLDGSSNMWISRKILEILETTPKCIVVQWSYAHRRELDSDGSDEFRRLFVRQTPTATTEDDIQNTIDCINLVEANKGETTIIHTFVPKNVPRNYRTQFTNLINQMNINVVWFDQIDYARDYHHYDILTSTSLVEKLVESNYINI
jgi:hypothetical protein